MPRKRANGNAVVRVAEEVLLRHGLEQVCLKDWRILDEIAELSGMPSGGRRDNARAAVLRTLERSPRFLKGYVQGFHGRMRCLILAENGG